MLGLMQHRLAGAVRCRWLSEQDAAEHLTANGESVRTLGDHTVEGLAFHGWGRQDFGMINRIEPAVTW